MPRPRERLESAVQRLADHRRSAWQRGKKSPHRVSPEAVSLPQETQAYYPCTVQGIVIDSAIADNNGPAASRGAGPMPVRLGDGAETASRPNEQCGAIFGL